MKWLSVFVVTLASAFCAGAGEHTPVDAVQPLRICIVELTPAEVTGENFQRDFTDRLGESLNASVENAVALVAECVNGREAASRLRERACDAVLVIGPDRPYALRQVDALAFASTLGWNRNCATIYLIVGHPEPAVRSKLGEGFRAAIRADAEHARKVAVR